MDFALFRIWLVLVRTGNGMARDLTTLEGDEAVMEARAIVVGSRQTADERAIMSMVSTILES
jgi:hypothetical protein